jgi:hypothetical protein
MQTSLLKKMPKMPRMPEMPKIGKKKQNKKTKTRIHPPSPLRQAQGYSGPRKTVETIIY